MKNLICFFIFLHLFGCSQTDVSKEASVTTVYSKPTPHYKRDSLYVAETIWQYIDKEVDIFDSYKSHKIDISLVKVYVDSVFYSPDSLKLFAFVIIKVPDNESVELDDFYYSGSDMIGYRDSTNSPWQVYYFGHYRPAGYDTYKKVSNLFRWYYLKDGKFKSSIDVYWDGRRNDTLGMAREITFPKQNNRVSIKFGYNIDDPLFWSKSIIWKKGNRIPGYYSFETNGSTVPGSNNPIKNIPKLDYPDSLLNLYK
jgi:hypothetical protein